MRARRDPTSLPEDLIRRDADGRPDLKGYDQPLEHYVGLHKRWAAYLAGKDFSRETASQANNAYIHGQWGLIAKGAEAVPYALSLLDSRVPEYREDAASILEAVGSDSLTVARLVHSAESEKDKAALDSMVQALGRMKAREAIPFIATVLRGGDQDSRWDAAEALGRIARKRFGDGPDRVEKALAWLEAQGL